MQLADLASLRQPNAGGETVYHLEDREAYRTLCERLAAEGYDFPQCLSGMDMEYGLRSVLHLRRLRDQSEVTIWLDVSYEQPVVPSVSDIWGGVEWHEREAYDLLGIHYENHPDLRRILLEDDWTIHPLQRRYNTGGYLIPDWQAKDWPDWDAIEAAKEEEQRLAAEAAKKRAEAAKAKAAAAKAKKQSTPAAPDSVAMPDVKTSDAAKVPVNVSAPEQSKQPAPQKSDVSDAPKNVALTPNGPVQATKAADSAGQRDDLKRIKGIGPKLEQLLNNEGIRTFKQVAALSEPDIERINERLNFSGRIEREQWREQAKAIIEGSET